MLARHLPPVTGAAGALAAGVAVRLAEASPALAAVAVLLGGLGLGIGPSGVRGRRAALVGLLLALGGWLHADASLVRRAGDCRWSLPAGTVRTTGIVGDLEGPGRFRLESPAGLPGGCRAPVRVVGRAGSEVAVGAAVSVLGRWSPSGGDASGDPLRAGVLLASAVQPASPEDGEAPASVRAARVRARAAAILERRLPREAGLAAALVVARRDALDPEVREAFVRSGTVHLLAISGFHVGVVALLAVGLVRVCGGTRRAAALAAALVAIAYAGVLGFPDAATRAALLVTLGAGGRILGRPTHGTGALATAFVVLVLADPTALGRIGFQLSFAGAFGLALVSGPFAVAARAGIVRAARALGRAPPPRALAEGPVAAVVDGVAASAGATLLTFPLVAWHFEAVSAVGIPATLVAGPLIAAALPGLLLVVGIDALGLPGASLPAAGAEALLTASRVLADAWAALPGAVMAVPRPRVVAGAAGLMGGALVLARTWGIARPVRIAAVGAGIATGLLLQPVADGAVRDGGLELHLLDVGQGDAIAIRTPGGRWLLVDAGPDPGDRLVRELRGLGVREIDLLVLTHPDLDHLGGAAEVIDGFDVRMVADPGTVRGTGAYREVLASAGRGGASWRVLARGDHLEIDGVSLGVLHPEALRPGGAGAGGESGSAIDPNDRSVVLRLDWRGFSALLTGDAGVADEEVFGPMSGPVDVLKVGHHGSRTSTGQALLDATRPALALVSLGRFNNFGHPDPGVVARLEHAGIPLRRTDLEGRITVRVDRAGRYHVTGAREAPN